MVRLRIALGVASSFVAVAALTLASAGTGMAQGNGNGNGNGNNQTPQNVNVVNTPLPVSGNVSAAVTGTVGLAPGAAVQIAGTADVVIANTDAEPIPTVDVHDARQPFQTRVTVTINPGSTQDQAGFDVPDGKRLVIEHVSARVQGPGGERYISYLSTHLNGDGLGSALHWLTLTYQGTFSSIDVLTANHDMRVYADPSFPSPQFVVTRTGIAGNTFAELNISGYLVNQ